MPNFPLLPQFLHVTKIFGEVWHENFIYKIIQLKGFVRFIHLTLAIVFLAFTLITCSGHYALISLEFYKEGFLVQHSLMTFHVQIEQAFHIMWFYSITK